MVRWRKKLIELFKGKVITQKCILNLLIIRLQLTGKSKTKIKAGFF